MSIEVLNYILSSRKTEYNWQILFYFSFKKLKKIFNNLKILLYFFNDYNSYIIIIY